jgi:ATP phosphoribosyltransferase
MSDEVEVPIEKLIATYRKMYAKKGELEKELQETISDISTKMATVKKAILNHMKDLGVESLKTTSGVAYRTIKTQYTTSDWESMNKFILEHQVPELLEKRIQQTNMRLFLEENPDLLPPGLNSNMEYSVTIRKS